VLGWLWYGMWLIDSMHRDASVTIKIRFQVCKRRKAGGLKI